MVCVGRLLSGLQGSSSMSLILKGRASSEGKIGQCIFCVGEDQVARDWAHHCTPLSTTRACGMVYRVVRPALLRRNTHAYCPMLRCALFLCVHGVGGLPPAASLKYFHMGSRFKHSWCVPTGILLRGGEEGRQRPAGVDWCPLRGKEREIIKLAR